MAGGRVARRVWRATVMLLVCAAPAVAQERSVLAGQVVNPQGKPIAEAEVTLLEGNHRTRVDANGRFRLDKLSAGRREFMARAIGHDPVMFAVDLPDESETTIELVLSPTVVTLQPLEVREKRREELFRRDLADRRGSGQGRILTGDEIRKRQVYRLSDALHGVAGMQIGHRPYSPAIIQTMRCKNVAVWVDGTPLTKNLSPGNGAEAGEALSSISPADVELMEVYSGLAELPGEFAHRGACAAIVVWTRSMLH